MKNNENFQNYNIVLAYKNNKSLRNILVRTKFTDCKDTT